MISFNNLIASSKNCDLPSDIFSAFWQTSSFDRFFEWLFRNFARILRKRTLLRQISTAFPSDFLWFSRILLWKHTLFAAKMKDFWGMCSAVASKGIYSAVNTNDPSNIRANVENPASLDADSTFSRFLFRGRLDRRERSRCKSISFLILHHFYISAATISG